MARKNEKKTEGSFNDLFFDNGSESSEGAQTLRLSEIEPNKDQPRKSFDKEALQQLADSITEHGVIQPLIVRSMPDGAYQIVAGERRWRAAKMAGLSEIPVVIRDDLSEEQAMQIAMIENLQRENLNPIEEALGYKELLDKYNITQDKLAKALGKARSSITNSLGLLNLPNAVQELLRSGSLSAGHCKALKKIKDEAVMIELAHKASEGELSVRQVEAIARRAEKGELSVEKTEKWSDPMSNYYREIEVGMKHILGTAVKVKESKQGNVLQISFKDADELKDIVAHFMDE